MTSALANNSMLIWTGRIYVQVLDCEFAWCEMKLQLHIMSGVLFACGVTAASSSTLCNVSLLMFLVFIPWRIPVQKQQYWNLSGILLRSGSHWFPQTYSNRNKWIQKNKILPTWRVFHCFFKRSITEEPQKYFTKMKTWILDSNCISLKYSTTCKISHP